MACQVASRLVLSASKAAFFSRNIFLLCSSESQEVKHFTGKSTNTELQMGGAAVLWRY